MKIAAYSVLSGFFGAASWTVIGFAQGDSPRAWLAFFGGWVSAFIAMLFCLGAVAAIMEELKK